MAKSLPAARLTAKSGIESFLAALRQWQTSQLSNPQPNPARAGRKTSIAPLRLVVWVNPPEKQPARGG